jgi:3-oxoacyl-[acyl-carrier protein] reductase
MHRYPSLQGRVVIVTGAGRGFGRLFALALAAQGAHVVGTAARAERELQDTGDAVRAGGTGSFTGLLADVANHEDCERVVAQALAHHARVDALINNAARGPMEANPDYFAAKPKFWEAPPDAYRRMVETNLVGAFYMARAAVRPMLEQGFGRIVNLSTSNPTMVMQGLAAYGATKAGLEAATVLWAKDLAGTGVTANVLLPGGPSDTALIPGGTVGSRSMPDFRAGKGPRGDEGRIGGILPAEIIVPPALWLCADDSADWNGRRFVAKDWDPDLSPAEAAARAVTEAQPAPRVM